MRKFVTATGTADTNLRTDQYPIAEQRESRAPHDPPRESDTQPRSDVPTFTESRH
jgi:hypothetical protein